ncbi:MAG: hypothetical protein COU22_02990 [Candidatus Komeilibacteria bacterium CG10_big_fil_rev_8_21_14_0_10_41_13]|uniref:Uncharacterized protein n=1 Tax=Candidatus Komeilibacteria bacterium CG10_big_fil_rev_8_21_14_0_10_41_13 TaxID=1974476 RepID=A0A2M6WBX9_9BACT|nr:MAG: hypothetical protein COU22_02990 [Candidatus Komeilibacteria bacterium CG10_big_fil_rev_8_21_14_0_10_41_13]
MMEKIENYLAPNVNEGGERLANKPEQLQTPEQIREVLETAFKEGRFVNLMIVGLSSSEAKPAEGMIIEELESEYADVTYIAEDGDLGELIPLKLSRITQAELGDKHDY